MRLPYVDQSVMAGLDDAMMRPRSPVGAIGVSRIAAFEIGDPRRGRTGFSDARGGIACLNPNIMTF
jgi:hypothetical protein